MKPVCARDFNNPTPRGLGLRLDLMAQNRMALVGHKLILYWDTIMSYKLHVPSQVSVE